jgi:hypothetical protein
MGVKSLLTRTPAWQVSLALHSALVLAMHLTIVSRTSDAEVHVYSVDLSTVPIVWPDPSPIDDHAHDGDGGPDNPDAADATESENDAGGESGDAGANATGDDGAPTSTEAQAAPEPLPAEVRPHAHYYRRLRLSFCPVCASSTSLWSGCLEPGCTEGESRRNRCFCNR